MLNKSGLAVSVAAIAMLGGGSVYMAQAQDVSTPDKETLTKTLSRPYSPYAAREYPTRPLFGDTHLHTAISFDAGAIGARLGPREAYRFAQGEEVISSTGLPVRLSRPLDFLVVADHSDNMGMITDLLAGKPSLLADPQGKTWYDMFKSGVPDAMMAATLQMIQSFGAGTFPKAITYRPGNPAYTSTWHDNIAAAEQYNAPGRFTALIGYEWTSTTNGNNLHRNVIYRDNGDKARQVDPMVTMKPYGSDNPRDLWNWMEAYEAKTGGKVLAIPHNGNLSNGRMFPMVDSFSGKPIDKDYVVARAKWEPLAEVTQPKGDGEAHPVLSPNDEYADFETWDKANLDTTVVKTRAMLEFEYARSALKIGLMVEGLLGVNPYKFGMIGSSDAHTGLAGMEEDNFMGKTPQTEPSPKRMTSVFMKNSKNGVTIMDWEVGASGYAAVWAKENTRASIWDAMQRRETYATTGPRMAVRFFGGWDFTAADANTRMPAETGYKKGVPMGGDLRRAGPGKVPTFLIGALKDPMGANLDRYQIVKGWRDASGKLHEKVYDVAWSGNRRPGANGKLPSVGNTVNIADASWTNTIGAPELIKVWRDPDFDPRQAAFYYGRVLEIPTPRWTAYDAKRFGISIPKGVRTVLQERAYTSPIWYTPS